MESGEAVFGGNMRDINFLLEDIVYLELLRCGYVAVSYTHLRAHETD